MEDPLTFVVDSQIQGPPEDVKPIICDLCSACFQDTISFEDHFKIHTKGTDLSTAVAKLKTETPADRNSDSCNIHSETVDSQNTSPIENQLTEHPAVPTELRTFKRHVDTKTYRCNKCDSTFHWLHEVKRHSCSAGAAWKHLASKSNSKTFCNGHQLKVCSTVYFREKQHPCDLQINAQLQDPTEDVKPIICNQCSTCFPDKLSFEGHYKMHMKEAKYINVTSNLQTKTAANIKPQSRNATKSKNKFKGHHCKKLEEMHVCKVCKKSFRIKTILKHHMYTHEKPYKCKRCDTCFATIYKLNDHTLLHKSNGYACYRCRKDFVYKGHWRRHSNACYLDVSRVVHECKLCGETFLVKYKLAEHRSLHTEDDYYVCEICLKRFLRKYDMLKHRMSHYGTVNHRCKKCSSTFNWLHELRSHICSANPKRDRFACTSCNKIFSDDHQLTEHCIVHFKEKPYQCEMCHKRFLWPQVLQRHLNRSHNIIYVSAEDKKVYTCDKCNRSYEEELLLDRHRCIFKKLEPVSAYKCTVCGEKFLYEISLKYHRCALSDKKKLYVSLS